MLIICSSNYSLEKMKHCQNQEKWMGGSHIVFKLPTRTLLFTNRFIGFNIFLLFFNYYN